MQSEQLNLKLEKGLFDEVDLISKVLHVPKNEWARNVLAHEVKKEIDAHKQFIVREYIKGSITRTALVKVLGAKEVANIDHIIKIGKSSFDDAKLLAGA
ncbi:hypothetical protein HY837_03820 [archaeon]|nr:hypothetical protein [archaeon]